jgi:hypothetical protein
MQTFRVEDLRFKQKGCLYTIRVHQQSGIASKIVRFIMVEEKTLPIDN